MTHLRLNATELREFGKAGVSEPKRLHLLNMPVDALTHAAALELIAARINARQSTWILTPNLDILRQYYAYPHLRPLFHREQGGADILLADGMPLVWAARLKHRGNGLPERIAGSSLVFPLAALAEQNHWRLFLLGGPPGAGDRTAAILQGRHRNLAIVGTCCPDTGFERDAAKIAAIREKLAAANPDLVYVALGFPKQEFLIQQLRPALPHATFIGVGISLSFMAGTVPRAPRWIQRLGCEWLHRLAHEPKRLAKRYLLQDLPFALLHLFPHALAGRFRS